MVIGVFLLEGGYCLFIRRRLYSLNNHIKNKYAYGVYTTALFHFLGRIYTFQTCLFACLFVYADQPWERFDCVHLHLFRNCHVDSTQVHRASQEALVSFHWQNYKCASLFSAYPALQGTASSCTPPPPHNAPTRQDLLK